MRDAVPADAPVDTPPRGPHGPRAARDRRDDGRPEQARPRDRTGRPLPYGTTGILTIEQVEPATVEDALLLAAARWDEQRYFEAHELLEHAWKQAEGSDRELWKGVIQVAVAGVHLQRGNPAGARRLLARSRARLAPLRDERCGVDVAGLRVAAETVAAVLARGEVPAADLGPFPRAAEVVDGVWFAARPDADAPSGVPTPILR